MAVKLLCTTLHCRGIYVMFSIIRMDASPDVKQIYIKNLKVSALVSRRVQRMPLWLSSFRGDPGPFAACHPISLPCLSCLSLTIKLKQKSQKMYLKKKNEGL